MHALPYVRARAIDHGNLRINLVLTSPLTLLGRVGKKLTLASPLMSLIAITHPPSGPRLVSPGKTNFTVRGPPPLPTNTIPQKVRGIVIPPPLTCPGCPALHTGL